MKNHGTAAKYATCKCDVCTDYNTKRNAELAAKRAGREPLVHNRNTYRNWKCHCDICSADHQLMLEERKALVPPGQGHRKAWTDAELEIVLSKPDGRRYEYTAVQAAKMLQRSVKAIDQQRHLARVRSRV